MVHNATGDVVLASTFEIAANTSFAHRLLL